MLARPALLTLAVLAATAATAPALAAPAPPAPPAPRTTVEGITEYALPNGLRVLLFPDASKETFTVNITYLVGSRMEGYGETGMAHLLEHMMFKGSPKHPKVWEELEQRGAANNASTWYDRTNYFETLTAKDDNLAWALELEADRMVNANIAPADLAKEFSVVRNEFEIGENAPAQILSERVWSTAYLWHNYGKSTIGSRADIERVPATTLKRFYKKYYRPDNAVLLIAGKFDPATALRLTMTHFAGLTNPATPIEPTYTSEPVQDGERVVSLRRTGDVQVVTVAYHVSAGAAPNFAAVEALADVLTAEPSGRLYAALVKPGLATSVTASALALHDPGLLEISAVVPPGKSLEAARAKLLAVVEGLAAAPVTDAEVARYRARAKKQFKMLLADSPELGVALSESIAAGDWRLFFLGRDRTAALTAADVQRATGYLTASNRTLGMFYPTKAPARAPAEATPDVAPMIAGYAGAPVEDGGETFDATVANIERRTTRQTLPSGMKLAILAKQTRGNVVRGRLTLRFGTEADFTGKRAALETLGDVLLRGTKHHTYQQLQDRWDELEAEVGVTSRPGQLEVDLQTTRANLPAVLALVDEVLREPSLAADQLELVRKEALTALEDGRSDPEAQGFGAMTRAVLPYPRTHPSYQPTTDEAIADVKAVTLAELKRLPPMFGTSDATLTLVGDLDAAAVTPWITQTWGAWKSPRPFRRIPRRYVATAGAELVLDFPDKANALILAAAAIPMRDDDPDAAAMEVADYTLGGGGFVSRLMTRLRQQDGLSYGAFSGWAPSSLDVAAFLYAGAEVNPQNARRGLAAMMEEVTRFAAHGITAAELKGAKDGLRAAFERDLADDDNVLGLLHTGLYLGRTLAFEADRQAAIAGLTTAQVNQVIQRRIDPSKLVRITAGDRAKF